MDKSYKPTGLPETRKDNELRCAPTGAENFVSNSVSRETNETIKRLQSQLAAERDRADHESATITALRKENMSLLDENAAAEKRAEELQQELTDRTTAHAKDIEKIYTMQADRDRLREALANLLPIARQVPTPPRHQCCDPNSSCDADCMAYDRDMTVIERARQVLGSTNGEAAIDDKQSWIDSINYTSILKNLAEHVLQDDAEIAAVKWALSTITAVIHSAEKTDTQEGGG